MTVVNRSQKIRFLKELKEGRANIEALLPKEIFMFYKGLDEPGTYSFGLKGVSKVLSEEEYLAFVSRIDERNKLRLNDEKHMVILIAFPEEGNEMKET